MKQAADDCGCSIHAYVLMSNHVHLLLTPDQPTLLARLFQSWVGHYVRYINETYKRHGSLWKGRYKSNIIQSQTYILKMSGQKVGFSKPGRPSKKASKLNYCDEN